MSSGSFSGLTGIDAGAHRVGNPGGNWINEVFAATPGDGTGVFGRAKSGTRSAAFMRFDMSSGAPVVGSLVTDAWVDVMGNISGGTGALDLVVALLVNDGIWNVTTAPSVSWTGHAPNEGIDLSQFRVRNTSAANISSVMNNGVVQKRIRQNPSSGRGLQELSQTIEITTAGTLGDIQVVLAWSAGMVGTFVVEVLAATANDGTDDRPTGSVLATSDIFTMTSVSGTAALRTVTFTAGPSLTLSNRYVFRIVPSFTPSASISMFALIGNSTNTEGSTVHEGGGSGFSEVAYPIVELFPHYLEQDGSTIRNAPFGSTVVSPAPDQSAPGGVISIRGLRPLLQEWISDSGYTPTDTIGMTFAIDDGVASNRERELTSATLYMEWREPQTRRGLM